MKLSEYIGNDTPITTLNSPDGSTLQRGAARGVLCWGAPLAYSCTSLLSESYYTLCHRMGVLC